MATSTVIPDDIKTLKSDVSKLKNDQGSYALRDPLIISPKRNHV